MEDIKRIHEDTVMFRVMLREPWAYFAAAFLIAAMGSLIATYAFTPPYVKTFRAQGVPITNEELAALYPEIPDSENGAIALLAALESAAAITEENFDLELIPFEGKARLPKPDEPIPPAMQQEILRAAAANADCVARIHEALAYPAFRFPGELQDGYFVEYAHPAKARGAARYLSLDGMRGILEQDFQGVANALYAQLRLAGAVQPIPDVSSNYLQQGISQMFHEMLHQTLNRSRLPEGELRRIGEELRDLQFHVGESITRGYTGEMVLALTVMNRPVYATRVVPDDAPEDSQVSESMFGIGVLVSRFTGFGLFSSIAYVRGMKTFIDAGDLPPHEALRVKFPALQDLEVSFLRTFFVSIMFPSRSRYEIAAEIMARAVTAQAAIAIERYRRAHGNEPPETLEALVPEYLETVPADPFDGAPLRYRRLPEGYVVYSIGLNLQDDGGTERPERKTIYQAGDILIRVTRP